jgi:hypothetical protein
MYLDRVNKKLIELKLAMPEEFLGCTQDEIIDLEWRLGISLPKAYQEFLLSMGHGAGKFLRGSDCFFKHLILLQEWAVELLEENHFPKSLPENAFVFFMHQGYQFSFFNLSEGDDPPTYFYSEGINQISFTKSHERFSEFLATEIEIHAQYLLSSIGK